MFGFLTAICIMLGFICLAIAFSQQNRNRALFCATVAGFNFGMILANLLYHAR